MKIESAFRNLFKHAGFFVAAWSLFPAFAFSQTGTESNNPIIVKGAQQKVETYNGHGYNTFVTYYDGLGRPVQTQAYNASPRGKDVISFTVYDRMGRDDSISYLPFVSATSKHGRRNSPVVSQKSFYMKILEETSEAVYAYSCKKYDDTPFNDVVKSASPGKCHIVAHPTTHMKRLNMTPSPSVSRPRMDVIHNFALVDDSVLYYKGHYGSFQLETYETNTDVTIKEKRKELEYRNRLGQTVAKGVRINDSLERLTYYVYDDSGNLRYTIPSIESDRIVKAGAPKRYLAKDLPYSVYHGYDRYGNRIIVRNPDQDPIYSVFDARRREILRQDGNQRTKHQWTYSEYDDFDRILRISTVYSDAAPAQIRAWFEECYGKEADKVVRNKFSGKRLLQRICYADYYEPQTINRIPIVDAQAAGQNAQSDFIIHGDTMFRQTVTIEPYEHFSIPEYLKYACIINISPYVPREPPTGAKIYEKLAVLSSVPGDTLSYVEKAYYYDKRGRNIQTVVKNHLGGISRLCNAYDFNGRVTRMWEGKQISENASQDILKGTYSYDDFGRLLCEKTSLNDSPAATVRYEYDELGRIGAIIYGDSVLTDRVRYDVEGRRTTQSNEAFDLTLRYDRPSPGTEATPNYTGMVTECSWMHKTSSVPPKHTYAYTYTPYGQLSGAFHYQDGKRTYTYEEVNIAYDANDNILKKTRFGGPSYTSIEPDPGIIINYINSGNKLSRLSTSDRESYKYTYDRNGNNTFDQRKGLFYEYNSLNLLNRAYGVDGRTMVSYKHLYDGTKLDASDPSGRGYSYLGSLIYQRNGGIPALESASFNGGLIRKTTSGYDILYLVCDYQGSVRAVVDAAGKIRSRTDYYPFGSKWQSANMLASLVRYEYNGKESQVTGGLNLLDYGARMYDPWLGRWMSPDPAMQLINPYVFCGNNPIVYIDKDGRFFWLVVGIAAAVGGYLGGAAANDNWNPFQWNWSSFDTWGGILGGAIQGGISGAGLCYGISGITGNALLGAKNAVTTFGRITRCTSFAITGAKGALTATSMINNFDNAMDIIRGNYLYSAKTFGGKILQGLSRGTYEKIQQTIGYAAAQTRNSLWDVDVFYFHGALVVNDPEKGRSGMTLGNIINGWGITGPDDQLLMHEYGHTIQSRLFGPYYGLWQAPASLINCAAYNDAHNHFSIERQANRYAKEYFGNLWDDKNDAYPTY